MRRAFWGVWSAVTLIKLALVLHLPLFVDEAFYWQESRHLAWAYSDLPGLTAWLIRASHTVFGEGMPGVRGLFLILGSALPWLVVLAARPLGERQAWLAGILTVLFPLSGLLGVLALPDVAMNVGAMACLLGGARAMRGRNASAALWLVLGLLLGGLSHYRFLGVMAVGSVVLLWLPQGRMALRDARLWAAITVGILAWVPLIVWNLTHGEAGWRFQLVDRHPWQFHADGFQFLIVQALLATPGMFLALLLTLRGVHAKAEPMVRWLALCGGLTLLGFFALGLVADAERVSFHWPLPGYLALLVLVPDVLQAGSRWLRVTAVGGMGIGLLLALLVTTMVASEKGRAALASWSFYPENFAGWQTLAEVVSQRRQQLPGNTQLVVDHFKLGAQLGFAAGDPDIAVLDHPLNHHHGRAAQLAQWGLVQETANDAAPQLLVVAISDLKWRERLVRYQALCQQFGRLPAPEVVNIDQGRRQFLLFALLPEQHDDLCIPPALVHVNTPENGTVVMDTLSVTGWAMKDRVGIDRVRVFLGDEVVQEATYGLDDRWVAGFFAGLSYDPDFPRVRFQVDIPVPPSMHGKQAISLEVTDKTGRAERWPGPIVNIKPHVYD